MIPISKPIITEQEKNNVLKVLNSGILAQGPMVKKLEEKFTQLCGTKYAIAVNSGTAAIHTSLYAIGIKPGDEIITTPFTFVASANPILMMGAKIIFADINEDTFNIDPNLIEAKITDKTKAIIAVDLYGHPADYKLLQKIAEKYHLLIIEDACQAINAELNNIKTGNFGNISTFSFYATKNIMCGEGGMITTNNKEYAELAKRFRNHGQNEYTKYDYYDVGYNYRMSDIQAAIVLAQLDRVEEYTQKRRQNAEWLTAGLRNVEGIKIPFVKNDVKHVYHQYTIKTGYRVKLIERLKANEIDYGIFYPKPLHIYPHFMRLGYKLGDFPVSEKVSRQVLSLPVHPLVSKEEIKKIISVVKND